MRGTRLHSKIRPSLRPGTPGDQADSDGGVLIVSWSRAAATPTEVGTRKRDTRVQTRVYE